MTGTRSASFGDLLRHYRQAIGLTQEELAERANLSARAISDLERGARQYPYRATMQGLATALRLTLEQRAAFEQAGHRPAAERAARARAAASAVRAAPSDGHPQHNLPAQLTSFVGRAAELAQIRALLFRADVRLLTLTGPPGTGKTRLAVQVAGHLRDEFEHGIWFVELAPLADPALVGITLAAVLGVADTHGPVQDQVAAYLRDKHVLLLLDNFEHLPSAAGLVEALLQAAPGLQVLATSRAPLRIYGEKEFPVPPLCVPDPLAPTSATDLMQVDAVRLFVERARDVQPEFTVTPETAPAVAEICTRLDGLPLAIELAAARCRLFPPGALLTRLASRLTLLTGGARTLPLRQHTLRNAIEWSHALLDPEEQRLLQCLALFQGGGTLEAIAVVCNRDAGPEVLAGVEALVGHSLLQVREGLNGEPRFGMLETIHEYARERLRASSEEAQLRAAHAAYYVRLAEEAAPHLRTAEQAGWLARLEAEQGNLRAALAWAAEAGGGELGLRLVVSLARFWSIQGYWTEGRECLAAALAAGPGRTPLRVRALCAAGNLARRQYDPAEQRRYADAALALAQDLGDTQGLADVLLLRSYGTSQAGDQAQGELLVEQALALYRRLEQQQDVADALYQFGRVKWRQGDLARARSLFTECLAAQPPGGDPRLRVAVLTSWGFIAQQQDQLEEARGLIEQALVAARLGGDKMDIAMALNELGELALFQDRLAEAQSWLEQSLAAVRPLGSNGDTATVLLGLAEAARALEDYPRARLCAQEGIELARLAEENDGVADGLRTLGYVCWAAGDRIGAAALWREALPLSAGPWGDWSLEGALVGLALVALAAGQPTHAAQLLGSVEALRAGAPSARLRPADQRAYELALADVRTVLDQATFGAAWAAGQAMSAEQAVTCALAGKGTTSIRGGERSGSRMKSKHREPDAADSRS